MCGPCHRTCYFLDLSRIKTYALVGRILHFIPIRFLRLVTTSVTFLQCSTRCQNSTCVCFTKPGQKLAICFTPCLIVACLFFSHWITGLMFGTANANEPCSRKHCLTMEAPFASSASSCSSLLTSPDSDGFDERNMWKPMLTLLCLILLAQSWSHTLKLFWKDSFSPATLHSTYFAIRLNFIIAKAEARLRGIIAPVECPLGRY